MDENVKNGRKRKKNGQKPKKADENVKNYTKA